MKVQHLTDQQTHLWLIQSQYFSLYFPLSHPDLWNVMNRLYQKGIHHLPTSLVQDILYIVQRKMLPRNQQKKVSLWQDYYTILQQLSFIENSNRYLLIAHQHRRKIYIYICVHILTKIAVHWSQRFFAYDFSELEIEHIKKEQKNTVTYIYNIHQYEKDLQYFISSISREHKNIGTLISKDILSVARHIEVLSEKAQQLAWISFQQIFEKGLLFPIEKKSISCIDEEPDSILEHHESQIYPRGGYNSISNRGSFHNILSSQFVYTDIDISTPSNHKITTEHTIQNRVIEHAIEVDKEEKERTIGDLDIFSLKYLKNELLYFRRDEGFLFRRKRQLIFIFEENPLWLYHSTCLNVSMGIAILALCRTIIDSLLQLQDRESISVDILVACNFQQNKDTLSREISNLKISETSNSSHQSFLSDIQFLSLFCKENISLHQHRVQQVYVESTKILPEHISELLRKEHESHILYFPMNFPLETTLWNSKIGPNTKSLTIVPSLVQNYQKQNEKNSSYRKQYTRYDLKNDNEHMYQIDDHSDFTDLQKLHDTWAFEYLPIKLNLSH